MKTNTIQQEILLVTTTTLSKREWCKLNASKSSPRSYTEQLEEACWNGLLDELLPEILTKSSSGKLLYLWHIRHSAAFLQIEMSEIPVTIEKQSSIYPNFFFAKMFNN